MKRSSTESINISSKPPKKRHLVLDDEMSGGKCSSQKQSHSGSSGIIEEVAVVSQQSEPKDTVSQAKNTDQRIEGGGGTNTGTMLDVLVRVATARNFRELSPALANLEEMLHPEKQLPFATDNLCALLATPGFGALELLLDFLKIAVESSPGSGGEKPTTKHNTSCTTGSSTRPTFDVNTQNADVSTVAECRLRTLRIIAYVSLAAERNFPFASLKLRQVRPIFAVLSKHSSSSNNNSSSSSASTGAAARVAGNDRHSSSNSSAAAVSGIVTVRDSRSSSCNVSTNNLELTTRTTTASNEEVQQALLIIANIASVPDNRRYLKAPKLNLLPSLTALLRLQTSRSGCTTGNGSTDRQTKCTVLKILAHLAEEKLNHDAIVDEELGLVQLLVGIASGGASVAGGGGSSSGSVAAGSASSTGTTSSGSSGSGGRDNALGRIAMFALLSLASNPDIASKLASDSLGLLELLCCCNLPVVAGEQGKDSNNSNNSCSSSSGSSNIEQRVSYMRALREIICSITVGQDVLLMSPRLTQLLPAIKRSIIATASGSSSSSSSSRRDTTEEQRTEEEHDELLTQLRSQALGLLSDLHPATYRNSSISASIINSGIVPDIVVATMKEKHRGQARAECLRVLLKFSLHSNDALRRRLVDTKVGLISILADIVRKYKEEVRSLSLRTMAALLAMTSQDNVAAAASASAVVDEIVVEMTNNNFHVLVLNILRRSGADRRKWSGRSDDSDERACEFLLGSMCHCKEKSVVKPAMEKCGAEAFLSSMKG